MIEVSTQSKIRRGILAPSAAMFQTSRMRKGPRPLQKAKQRVVAPAHFIRAWRVLRGMTVEELAEKSGLATGTISAIENRTAGYSPESLEAIAGALRVPAGFLLSVNPLDESNIWPLWELAAPEQRRQIAALARVVVNPAK